MDISTAANRTEVYAFCKAEGIPLTDDIKSTLNLGGLKDYVRRQLAEQATPGTDLWKIKVLKGMTPIELLTQYRSSVRKVESTEPLSSQYFEAMTDQTLAERELLARLG